MPIAGARTGATTPKQSGPGNSSNDEVYPRSSNLQFSDRGLAWGCSLSTYPGSGMYILFNFEYVIFSYKYLRWDLYMVIILLLKLVEILNLICYSINRLVFNFPFLILRWLFHINSIYKCLNQTGYMALQLLELGVNTTDRGTDIMQTALNLTVGILILSCNLSEIIYNVTELLHIFLFLLSNS